VELGWLPVAVSQYQLELRSHGMEIYSGVASAAAAPSIQFQSRTALNINIWKVSAPGVLISFMMKMDDREQADRAVRHTAPNIQRPPSEQQGLAIHRHYVSGKASTTPLSLSSISPNKTSIVTYILSLPI